MERLAGSSMVGEIKLESVQLYTGRWLVLVEYRQSDCRQVSFVRCREDIFQNYIWYLTY